MHINRIHIISYISRSIPHFPIGILLTSSINWFIKGGHPMTSSFSHSEITRVCVCALYIMCCLCVYCICAILFACIYYTGFYVKSLDENRVVDAKNDVIFLMTTLYVLYENPENQYNGTFSDFQLSVFSNFSKFVLF